MDNGVSNNFFDQPFVPEKVMQPTYAGHEEAAVANMLQNAEKAA